MREKRKNKIIIFSLLGLLCLMAAGYAAFQTNLKIKGTSGISSNWDIKITNVTKSNETGGVEEVKTPTWTDLTAYMEANLYEKGDSIEYDVTVQNDGTIDASLDNISENIKSTNEAVKITFSGYTKGEKLFKNSSQIIKVKIEYNPDFNGKLEEGSGEISVDLNYTQAEGGTIIPTDKYLVTYDCMTNGGDNCSNYNEYLAEGDSVKLDYISSKKDAVFIGWNTDKDATEGLTELQMGTEDIVLYAIFESNKPIIKSWCDDILSENTFPRVISTEFHSDEYRERIISATFLDNKNVPENAIISWDVSEAGDKSVMAWLMTNNGDNSKYDLYIGGNGGVIANKNSSYLFFKFYNLKTIDFGTNYDTSNVTNMQFMFDNYATRGALNEIKGLENFDTSKVTNMDGMFRNGSYTVLDLSNFDVSNVISTNSMFDKNEYLKTINLSNWKTDSLENMAYMFNSCHSLETVDIRHFNTKNVNTMKALFQHCPKLKEINLGTWDTSNVENMDSMFYYGESGDSQLRKINLCSFDTSKVTNMNHMFCNTKSLEKVYVGSKWTTAKASVISMWASSKISSVTQSNNCMIEAETSATINLSTSKTTNSITVVPNASAESGIEKYEYSINGGEWIEDNNFHKFIGLTKNTEYSIKVRVTSKVGKVTTSNELKVTTNELEIPTFVESEIGTGGKKVTITYPEGCGDSLTCSYQKDDEEWVEVTESSKDVMYLDSGSLVAKTSDGTNEVSSSYAIIFTGEDIEYTGGEHEYTVDKDGYYKIELWGAQGGKVYSDTDVRPGAYTSGEIYLTKGEKLYLYIGQQGHTSNVCSSTAGFNNGAISENANGACGPTGGGATDVRLVNGAWNDVISLRSRIMVAAGGTFGADGGDLIGREIAYTYEYYDYVGRLAKQRSGGVAPTKFSVATSNGTAGGFGFAGNGGASVATTSFGGGASGSSGYYGGSGASGLYSGVFPAGSGSSYISGYAGSNSITSASSGTHTNQTKHYSEKYFINTEMISGANTGDGKAKITYLKYPSNKDSTKIKGVRYIKDCINGNDEDSENHWVEIQAINKGENVAKGKSVSGLKNSVPSNSYNNTDYAFSYAVDGMMDNHGGNSGYAYMGESGNQCLIVDLGKEYDLEEIAIWHYFRYDMNVIRSYNNNVTYVAGNDGNYSRSVSLSKTSETPIGIRIKEFK